MRSILGKFVGWRPFISRLAQPVAGTRLHVVPAHGVQAVTHCVPLASGLCPVSGNPLSGEVRIDYAPAGTVLELVSLWRALDWATRSRERGTPRTVEQLAGWVQEQCERAVGVGVNVFVTVHVQPGSQRYEVRLDARLAGRQS